MFALLPICSPADLVPVLRDNGVARDRARTPFFNVLAVEHVLPTEWAAGVLSCPNHRSNARTDKKIYSARPVHSARRALFIGWSKVRHVQCFLSLSVDQESRVPEGDQLSLQIGV
jgi:hypothetical protein